MTAWITFPCGCRGEVDHASGDRLCICRGGGLSPKNGSVARESLRECAGGVRYKVTAEPVATVRYAVCRLKVSA